MFLYLPMYGVSFSGRLWHIRNIPYTVYVLHLVDIEFGKLVCDLNWQIFSLVTSIIQKIMDTYECRPNNFTQICFLQLKNFYQRTPIWVHMYAYY